VNLNSKESKDRRPPAEKAKPVAKRPYVKPEVRHEKVFETMALSCGKVSGTQGPCHSNRRTS
jgi:hypothetical protein